MDSSVEAAGVARRQHSRVVTGVDPRYHTPGDQRGRSAIIGTERGQEEESGVQAMLVILHRSITSEHNERK